MKRRIVAFALIVAVVFAFGGCAKKKTDGVVQPINKNIKTPTMGIPLYFGYKNQNFLCAEIRDIPQSYDASIEQLAINELIKGPGNNSELYSLIPAGTKVRVSGVSDTLFVTLSEDFFSVMPGETKNYQNNPEDLATVLNRRKLAVYSIVNTVTEIGNYSRVQILIGDNSMQEGYRPKMYSVGFSTVDDGKFLDTLPRTPNTVLTPANAVSGVLSLMQEKRWKEAYNCLYQTESTSRATVSVYDFEAYAGKSNIKIEDFSINNNFTYNDNGIAVVNVNFTVRNNKGATEYTQVPIKVALYNNIWKVEYSSITRILAKVG